MKICYVANSRFPSERAHMTQIVHMCNAFAKEGHHVTLVVTDRKSNIGVSPEEYFGVRLAFDVARIHVPDIAGYSPKIPPKLRPYVFFFQRLIFALRTSKLLRDKKIEVAYGRDEGILWLLTLLTRSRVVWESHEAKYSVTVWALLKRIDKFVVISEGIRDFYIKKEIPESRMIVAHDAVDSRFFEKHISQEEVRAQLGIRTEKPVVMYIGGLDRWKGVETLFKASEGTDEYEVFVIGGNAEELAEMASIYPKVHFLGPKEYKELPKLQQAADILVIPNTGKNKLSAEFTSPLKLFAYMTSKKPIVAARILSIKNVLSDQECFFFTADNPSSLNGTILEVLSDMNEGRVKAQKAYEKSKYYSWRERAKNILDHIST